MFSHKKVVVFCVIYECKSNHKQPFVIVLMLLHHFSKIVTFSHDSEFACARICLYCFIFEKFDWLTVIS